MGNDVGCHATGFQITFINAFFIEAFLSAIRLGMFFLPGGIGVKEIGYFALFASLQLPVSLVQIGTFVLAKRLVGILCVIIGYLFLFAQGMGLIWRRESFSYKTIMERS